MPTDDEPDHLFKLAEQMQGLVNSNSRLVHRGRFLSTKFMLQIGTKRYHYEVLRGELVNVRQEALIMSTWHFCVRGEFAHWARFWRPYPEPGWHDIFALAKLGRFRIEGDFQPLMTNLFYFKSVFAAPRQLIGAA